MDYATGRTIRGFDSWQSQEIFVFSKNGLVAHLASYPMASVGFCIRSWSGWAVKLISI